MLERIWTILDHQRRLLILGILGFILSFVNCNVAYLEPEFLPTPTNVTYSAGDLAILFCAVKNLGSKYVSWRKTSDPSPLTVGTLTYAPDSRFHVKYLNYRGEWNLYIKNVSKKDAGLYECQVSTELRDMRSYVLLNVLDPKTTTTTESSRQKDSDVIFSGPSSVELGSELTASCNVSTIGYDPKSVHVDWFIEGMIAWDGKHRINISTEQSNSHIISTLTIKHATKNDTGEYLCKTSYDHIARQHIFVLNGAKSSSNIKRGTDITDTKKSSTNSNHGHNVKVKNNFVIIQYLTVFCILNLFVCR